MCECVRFLLILAVRTDTDRHTYRHIDTRTHISKDIDTDADTDKDTAKERYKRDDILQKRPLILRSLLIVATP